MGRAAVPNMLWDMPAGLPESAWERVRLVPYWTSRAGRLLRSLEKEIGIASLAFERLDGSGYFRGLAGSEIALEGRILAAAVAKAALGRPRPWRSAYPEDQVRELLFEESRKGRLDSGAVRALFPEASPSSWVGAPAAAAPAIMADDNTPLSEREKEVLRYISLGESNKVVAQRLSISPSTVRSHVESVFRKLRCTTRAAATLRAVQLGILDPTKFR
ncbi:helix-turn-helix transcriptional regulator [Pinirhizobacter soli]|uniref:helix-turn-helix transcriptional regulator n=1 Tax=Pinirhizobacter soli TaxID=2786953 RepID=UPI0031F2F844